MGILDARNVSDVIAESSRNGARHTHSVQSLFNVAKSPPATGSLIAFDPVTKLWTPTSFTSLAAGDIPVWDGTEWTNQPSGVPTGTIATFAGSSAPTGWALCYGQAISRTTFSTLFGVIGTTYGAGDGSTTFNLPDLRGRVMVGLDNMGGSDAGRLAAANTLGGSGGAETVALSTSEIPNHTHHAAGTSTDNTNTTRGGSFMANNSGVDTTHVPGPGNITNSGDFSGGSAHNNMQPYMLLNHIIKA